MKYILALLVFYGISQADNVDGEKVFRKYCWGCHHQTAMAFGPPFSEIAKKRTKAEIMAYISSPKTMYKEFGYKRTVMTQLHLTPEELDAISDYVLSFKGKK
jgi:mono/diheme cytochrome c family protein